MTVSTPRLSGPPGAAGPPQPVPPPDLSMWTVGVVGLGVMGAGLAHRLAEAGATLRVFNRTSATARAVAGERSNVTAADTPARAAGGAQVVFVSVADDTAVRDVLLGPGGVLRGPAEAAPVVVVTSTVAPDTAAELARYGPVLDAGLLGNRQHARTGALRWYVGGPADLLDRVRPVLEGAGRQVLHVGPAGSGMRLKLAMNLLMGLEMQALAEVVLLGTAAGLDRQLVLDAVSASGFAAPVMAFKARRMAEERYDDPDFRLRLMAKDLELVAAELAAADLALPLAVAAGRSHHDAVLAGYGDADCAAILPALLASAGPDGGDGEGGDGEDPA